MQRLTTQRYVRLHVTRTLLPEIVVESRSGQQRVIPLETEQQLTDLAQEITECLVLRRIARERAAQVLRCTECGLEGVNAGVVVHRVPPAEFHEFTTEPRSAR